MYKYILYWDGHEPFQAQDRMLWCQCKCVQPDCILNVWLSTFAIFLEGDGKFRWWDLARRSQSLEINLQSYTLSSVLFFLCVSYALWCYVQVHRKITHVLSPLKPWAEIDFCFFKLLHKVLVIVMIKTNYEYGLWTHWLIISISLNILFIYSSPFSFIKIFLYMHASGLSIIFL